MAKRGAHKATKKGATKKPIESYDHKDKKRANNPPVGLVTPQTDPERGAKKTYQYDPHLDPQLAWAGIAEHTSFQVPTVSLHVHERIDPKTIIEAIWKNGGNGQWIVDSGEKRTRVGQQMLLFERPEENPPLREAIEFYKPAQESRLPAQKVGGHWRFHRATIDDWLGHNTTKRPPQHRKGRS